MISSLAPELAMYLQCTLSVHHPLPPVWVLSFFDLLPSCKNRKVCRSHASGSHDHHVLFFPALSSSPCSLVSPSPLPSSPLISKSLLRLQRLIESKPCSPVSSTPSPSPWRFDQPFPHRQSPSPRFTGFNSFPYSIALDFYSAILRYLFRLPTASTHPSYLSDVVTTRVKVTSSLVLIGYLRVVLCCVTTVLNWQIPHVLPSRRCHLATIGTEAKVRS